MKRSVLLFSLASLVFVMTQFVMPTRPGAQIAIHKHITMHKHYKTIVVNPGKIHIHPGKKHRHPSVKRKVAGLKLVSTNHWHEFHKHRATRGGGCGRREALPLCTTPWC